MKVPTMQHNLNFTQKKKKEKKEKTKILWLPSLLPEYHLSATLWTLQLFLQLHFVWSKVLELK